MAEIKWMDAPEDHDYEAAYNFLRLTYGNSVSRAVADVLPGVEPDQFRANDILRASGLKVLGHGDPSIKHDVQKIENGEPLSPILLINDQSVYKLVIADGYHRVCAVNLHDPKAMIPCKIMPMYFTATL